jgi:hypothetical protein
MKTSTEYRIRETYNTPQYGRVSERLATRKTRNAAAKYLAKLGYSIEDVKQNSYTDHNGILVTYLDIEV